jgi:tetratricopeptide (TPR) repeat protein
VPVSLSNRKLKQVRRLAGQQTPEQIARATGVPMAEVVAALKDAPAASRGASAAGVPREVWFWLPLYLAVVAAPWLVSKWLHNLCNLPQSAWIQVTAVLLAGLWGAQHWGARRIELRLGPLHWPVLLFLAWSGLTGCWAVNHAEFWTVWGHWALCGVWFLVVAHAPAGAARWHRGVWLAGLGVLALGCAIYSGYWLGLPALNAQADRSWDTWGCWLLLGCWLLIGWLERERQDAPWRAIPRLLFWSGLGLSLLGFGQHFLGWQFIPQVAFPSATFANTNFTVHYLVPAIALGLGLALGEQRPRWIWTYAGALTVMLSYLFYTKSRGGWLAFALVLAAWALYGLWQWRALWCGALGRLRLAAAGSVVGLTLILIHLGPQGFHAALGEQFKRSLKDVLKLREIGDVAPPAGEGEKQIALPAPRPPTPSSAALPIPKAPVVKVGADASFAGRVKVWQNTLYMVKDYPLRGVGAGNFYVYFPIYDGRNDGQPMFSDRIQLENAHNDYVNLWAELGTPGLLLALWTLGAIAAMVGWLLVKVPQERLTTLGLGTALLALAACAITSSPMLKAVPPLVFALLIACLTRLWIELPRGLAVGVPRLVPRLLALAALLALVPLLVLQYHRCRGDNRFFYQQAAAKQQLWPRVLEFGNEALAQAPWRSKAHALNGKAYIELTRYDQAIASLERDLAVNPYSPNTLFDLGVAHAKNRQPDQAMAYYRRLEKLMPAYPRLHNNIGALFMEQQKIDQALEEFRLEGDLNPDNERVWFNYGVALIQAKQYDEALKALRYVTEIKPDWALAWKNLGVVLFVHLGQRDAGLDALAHAVTLDPNLEEADKIRAELRKAGRPVPAPQR